VADGSGSRSEVPSVGSKYNVFSPSVYYTAVASSSNQVSLIVVLNLYIYITKLYVLFIDR